jgi:hypothetical protein
MKRWVFLVLSALTLSQSLADPYESRFADLRLPLGVVVKIPKNWWLLDGHWNTTIETAGEAALNLTSIGLPAGKKVNLFRANSMPKSTYASIAINATDSQIDPTQLRRASEAEIRAMAPEMKQLLQELLATSDLQVIEFYDVRREFISGHPALVIEYLRTGQAGPVVVQLTQPFLGAKEISINLAYRQAERQLWKPVVAYIRKSFAVKSP